MKTKWVWFGIVLGTTFAFIANFVPAMIIQPFKAQTPNGIEISYLIHKWSPIVTVLILLINLFFLAVLLKRTNRWWKRTAAVLLFLMTGIFAWFSHQNYFEWMFRPLPDAAYVHADEQKFTTGNDMVLAMNINGDAVAYPVRLLAYHHLVNDTVGGKPIVATY
jgi:hypothetical protein